MSDQNQQTTSIQAPGVQKDIQGNPTDRNIQGNLPKDGQGNTDKDFYGNPK
jgi:hypothetical protein